MNVLELMRTGSVIPVIATAQCRLRWRFLVAAQGDHHGKRLR